LCAQADPYSHRSSFVREFYLFSDQRRFAGEPRGK
jgi:hypothetical protein